MMLGLKPWLLIRKRRCHERLSVYHDLRSDRPLSGVSRVRCVLMTSHPYDQHENDSARPGVISRYECQFCKEGVTGGSFGDIQHASWCSWPELSMYLMENVISETSLRQLILTQQQEIESLKLILAGISQGLNGAQDMLKVVQENLEDKAGLAYDNSGLDDD